MKKLFLLLSVSLLAFGCQYDDSELWDELNDATSRLDQIEEALDAMNSSIESLETIVNALNEGKVIIDTEQTSTGYILTFSDNSTVEITNGEKGEDGEAPIIGVSAYEGVYYWTITVGGEYDWLYDGEGNPVAASGTAGVTPTLGVDADGYWTVDTGDGAEQLLDSNNEPVSSQGEAGGDGDSFFSSVTENDTTVTLTLTSGDVITLPKYIEYGVSVKAGSDLGFSANETKTIELNYTRVAYTEMYNNNSSWSVTMTNGNLEVTAPATSSETTVRLLVAEEETYSCKIVLITLFSYTETRTLTFEDEDYAGSGNYLGISDWSSLIDDVEYGGMLLYGEDVYDYDKGTEYNWSDDNNTMLSSEFIKGWYPTSKFWDGGHAISNYLETDLTLCTSYDRQLSIPAEGGNNGSSNFAVHGSSMGYITDYTDYPSLPTIKFSDSTERQVESMAIIPTSYSLSVMTYGNDFTPAIGDEDYFRIDIIGYDANGTLTGVVEYYLAQNGTILSEEWTVVDLTSLGRVAELKFNLRSNVANDWGLLHPTYFAYDDVVVRF